mgnify:CR=1 FL=1
MTTYMNNGRGAIKRRINYMANFKRPKPIWTIVIGLSIALLGAGCLSNGTGTAKGSGFEFKNINGLLGKEKDEVLEVLKIDPEEDAESGIIGEEEKLIMKEPIEIDGEDAEIAISFYNDILTSAEYVFEDGKTGYEYAKKIKAKADEIYGEPITYPELENRLENLEEFKEEDIGELVSGGPYHESWATEDDENVLKALIGDRKVEDMDPGVYGTDLVLQLAFGDEGQSWVQVRYSAARNPRGEWRISS